MADQNKKEELKLPEKNIPAVEKAELFEQKREVAEQKEISPEERIVLAELRKEIEMMESDETMQAEAEKKAEKIEFLGEKEKIEHLLKIAREKGLVFAIQVARKMNEPYLLDILHDTLASEGYYKDFTK